ncbi:MAG: diaminopimelate epimerase [Alphaproteobacteria bacterium]|nr:diaminopimelate epimerase [Alphaproteobacteria bacterium]MDA7982550.1 diaminopimelate epimerase [Alphaproteobacteria bacterium]MDA8008787.1 diaminopimelate epimerase [Alphaproteobacteria bacterium]
MTDTNDTNEPPVLREFRRAHGIGNDFIIFDARYEPLEISAEHVRRLARRDGGFGCDQVLVMRAPTSGGAARMEVYNADGSSSSACGNGARCLGWLLLQERGGGLSPVNLEAGDDMLECRLVPPLADGGSYGDSATGWVEVVLPAPRFAPHEIPLTETLDTREVAPELLAEVLGVASLPGVSSFVNLGNPHFVIEVMDAGVFADFDLGGLARVCGASSLFREGVNLQMVFCEGTSDGRAILRHRVWERGAGETLSSGTGAAAAAVALVRRGRISGEARVVEPGGGVLLVSWTGEEGVGVRQRGPVTFTLDSEMDWPPV